MLLCAHSGYDWHENTSNHQMRAQGIQAMQNANASAATIEQALNVGADAQLSYGKKNPVIGARNSSLFSTAYGGTSHFAGVVALPMFLLVHALISCSFAFTQMKMHLLPQLLARPPLLPPVFLLVPPMVVR